MTGEGKLSIGQAYCSRATLGRNRITWNLEILEPGETNEIVRYRKNVSKKEEGVYSP